jgi:uncharacterized DUF497 family protein
MALRFEWDENKAKSNTYKYGVAFEKASSVFADPLAAIFDDETHSTHEPREIIIGHSAEGRLLIVSYTERDGAVRIISAREATKRERSDYEQRPIR